MKISLTGLSLFFVCVISCTAQTSGFTGNSNKLSKAQTAPNGNNVEPATQFSLHVGDVLTSYAKHDIWFVSQDGNVERYSAQNQDSAAGLAGETWSKTGQWKLSGPPSGHRTYVSEAGLIVGKTGTAAMYRIGDDTPQGATVDPVWSGSEVSADDPQKSLFASRFCVTSFKVGDRAFVGGGYVKTGNRMAFVRIPIDKTKQNSLDVGAAQEQIVGNGTWGYSCFTDQSRNIYWGMRWEDVYGLNLVTGALLKGATDAPNSNFVGAELDKFSLSSASRRSYALSGDAFGNLLNGKDMYTYAYEPLSHTVFGTTYGDTKLTITRAECFSSKKDCAAGKDHWVFDLSAMGAAAGPLSSLNDGRIVGVSVGQVFLFSLKDPSNPEAGAVAKKIADATGNGYMYTDFTGGTLYAATIEKSVDFAAQKGWVPGKGVVRLNMQWIADSGQPEAWRGLKLEARCYTKASVGAAKPAYASVSNVAAAGTDFEITVGGCKNALVDSMDFRISPNNSSGGFSKTSAIALNVGQVK